MMHSPMHRHLFLTDLEWLLLPPLLLKQFRVYRRDKVPFAYVSWALLTAEVEDHFRNGVRRLKPGDWNAGDRLWLIDFIAPFGGADAVVKDLREELFPEREIKTLRLAEDGSGVRVETCVEGVRSNIPTSPCRARPCGRRGCCNVRPDPCVSM